MCNDDQNLEFYILVRKDLGISRMSLTESRGSDFIQVSRHARKEVGLGNKVK